MSQAVVEQNLFFLHQGLAFFQGLDDSDFARRASDRPRAAGMGPHLRHCLDFYLCFLRDFESGRIDYDARDRESGIESDRGTAIATIESIVSRLTALDDLAQDREIEVRCDCAPFEQSDSAWHRSTVGRELRFLASHTVHHYALIAEVARALDIEPGEDFGVAPATLAYWQTQSPA